MKRENSLIRFWKAAYGDYLVGDGAVLRFAMPGFPSPLLSAHFRLSAEADLTELAYFSELSRKSEHESPPGFRLRHQFLLGERDLRGGSRPDVPGEEMPLAQALQEPKFRELLAEGFPEDAPFLVSLLGFLASTRAEFRTFFLGGREYPVGIVTVGVAGGVALALNAVVSTRARGQGHSNALVSAAEGMAVKAGATEACFWTQRSFLGMHADRLYFYRVFQRAEAERGERADRGLRGLVSPPSPR